MELIYGISAETALESQTARFSVDILVIEQSRHCRKAKYPLKISAIPPWILHVINDSTILPAILSSSTHRIFIINLRRISIPFTIFPQIRSIREGRRNKKTGTRERDARPNYGKVPLRVDRMRYVLTLIRRYEPARDHGTRLKTRHGDSVKPRFFDTFFEVLGRREKKKKNAYDYSKSRDNFDSRMYRIISRGIRKKAASKLDEREGREIEGGR